MGHTGSAWAGGKQGEQRQEMTEGLWGGRTSSHQLQALSPALTHRAHGPTPVLRTAPKIPPPGEKPHPQRKIILTGTEITPDKTETPDFVNKNKCRCSAKS